MKVFYQLLANSMIATIANMTVWFAIIFYIILQSETVIATSILSGIYLVTVASTSIWFGGIVDKYDKKKSMIYAGIFTLIIFSICFLIYLSLSPDTFKNIGNPIVWIFSTLVLFGVIAGNIRGIAMPALVPVLTPEESRDKANGLVGTAFGISFFVVSIISGFLVASSGMTGVFIISIVLNILTMLHLLTIKIPKTDAQKSAQTKDEIPTKEINSDDSKKIDFKGTYKIVKTVPGLLSLILFTTFNNFLGGTFMSLMDAYGLTLVSVEVWGVLWGGLSLAFILGGILIVKKGLGKNPLRTLFVTNIIIWSVCSIFTIQPSIILLAVGSFIYLTVVPFIEASEHTIIQKVVPQDRLGRVFGFAMSVEQSASPITAFLIGPITQFIFIPFMTDGAGAQLIGSWYGTGAGRGIALVFTLAGIIGLVVTLLAMRTRQYKLLSKQYVNNNE